MPTLSASHVVRSLPGSYSSSAINASCRTSSADSPPCSARSEPRVPAPAVDHPMDLRAHVVGDLLEAGAVGHQGMGEPRGAGQLLHHLIRLLPNEPRSKVVGQIFSSALSSGTAPATGRVDRPSRGATTRTG